jgi:hypothetical protein
LFDFSADFQKSLFPLFLQLVKRCEEEINQLDRVQNLFPNDQLYLHDKDALSVVSCCRDHHDLSFSKINLSTNPQRRRMLFSSRWSPQLKISFSDVFIGLTNTKRPQ